ncbi:MAG: tyrosine--tRNA ligase [Kiritimatiellia bacterium]|jgi:tyrosyl-tRNA synthetase|nr:tyrosine--tRNA ligase [Kiritimatiellia bacterium]MDP6848665.1 tyrosine--tRNA ligase [Kiritimatiellia bacterium]
MNNIIAILKERCLFDNVTSPDLEEAVSSPMTVYAGFDPSSESLQAGNFVTIMALAHFQRCGHKVIAVVGGATGLIGDPSGKASERKLLSQEAVEKNQEGIHENLSRFLDFEHPTAPAAILNNYDWLGKFSFVDFLRDVGKNFRMGTMLGKDSVRTRLQSEEGMSFTEFSYQLLQAFDFLQLHDSHGCILQIGGSDQWGNITAGIDLLRRLRGVEAFGVTIPLVCDSSGQKFGKSEGNAIYLDSRKTSYYDFYQFFFRTDDADVIRFLKIFTFVPLEEIAGLERELREEPERRSAQRRLAEEVTRAVHGDDGLGVAQRCTGAMFGQAMEGLHAEELLSVFADVPSRELSLDAVVGNLVVNVAAESGLCGSRGEARRLAQSGGLYLNNCRVGGVDEVVSEPQVIDGKLLVLRSGKKRYHIVRVG